jgi:hypothetical protein
VGVSEKASNKSAAITPSVSIWFWSVVGGPPISEQAISTRKFGVQGVGLAVGVAVTVTVAVGVGVGLAVGVGKTSIFPVSR